MRIPDRKVAMHSRRWFLATGVGLAAAACAGPHVPRPTASPTGPIRSQLDEVLGIIAGGAKGFGVAIRDARNGASYGFGPDYSSQNASMVKPMIALMALRKADNRLTPEQDEQVRAMITRSDNDAADALWAWAGGADAYSRLAADLGMTASHRDPTRPDWSWTWTTPVDQIRLLDLLVTPDTTAVDPAALKLVYDLMGQVIPEQSWGVGQPRSSSVHVHLKNGWVQFKSSDGLWAVNSMGTVAGEGRDYRLAVMTRTPDFETGRETANEVGKQVFSILGSGHL